jgi:hypothetical protein
MAGILNAESYKISFDTIFIQQRFGLIAESNGVKKYMSEGMKGERPKLENNLKFLMNMNLEYLN